MGLLRVSRYGLRVFNRMVSFFFNAQPVTRNIIFQCKNNICLRSTTNCRYEVVKHLINDIIDCI
jgi:hypothetical protein